MAAVEALCQHGRVTERFASWAQPGSAPTPAAPDGGLARLRRHFRDFSWFDLISVTLGLLVWDFVTGLCLSGYFSIRCGGDACTLRQDLRRDELLYWLIPLVMILPPVLMAFWRKKMRSYVIVFQVVILGALMIHTAQDAHTQRQRIDGTVPCWNNLYTPKDCPWGQK